MVKKPGNKPWTTGEIRLLARMARDGAGAEAIAASLGRSVGSVRRKAAIERLSLRRIRKGRLERRGKVLGEPNRGTWAGTELAPVREAITTGRVDPGELERLAVDERPLCPRCATRPIETAMGFCRPCSAEGILAAWRRKQEHKTAERALAAARSERRRRRQEGKL